MEHHTEFELFGASHIVALLILGLVIWGGLRYFSYGNNQLHGRNLHRGFVYLLLGQLVFWRLVFVVYGEFDPLYDYPFHLCGLSTILLALYLKNENQTLFDVLFYWIFTGSVLGVLIPDLSVDFPHPRYFAMFSSHGTSVLILLYLLIYEDKEPRRKSYHTALLWLLGYGMLIALPINAYTGSNYLFLFHVPTVDFQPIQWLPPWPWYLMAIAGFFYLLYYAIYHAYYAIHEERELFFGKTM